MITTIEELIRNIVREELQKYSSKEEDFTMTTEEVMLKYKIKSKATLNAYHKMGLPYFKGKPNLYFKSQIENFFKQNQIRR